MTAVSNPQVWNNIRTLFVASLLLFLANIALGFDQALATDAIPRWQSLTHLHAGTLGWVTLSIIGLAIWIMTGEREVDEAYERRVTWLCRLGIVAFGGYIIAFALAFSRGRPFFYLMPIFGIASSLTIWLATVFAITQYRKQAVPTNAHLLITAGLLAAAIASTMGVLLGLEYLVGFFVPGVDRIGVHAAGMDGYLLLAAAAIVSWLMTSDTPQRRTRSALVVAVAWIAGPMATVLASLFAILPLLMLSVPLLLLGLIVFLVTIGRHALRVNPFNGGARRWAFFGTIWTIFWGALFSWVIVQMTANGGDFSKLPLWIGAVFAHAAFVGTMTNLLLGVYAVRSIEAASLWPGVETAALWLINTGLLLFFALKITADIRLGALVMGAGVLSGVVVMLARLRAVRITEMTPVAATQ